MHVHRPHGLKISTTFRVSCNINAFLQIGQNLLILENLFISEFKW